MTDKDILKPLIDRTLYLAGRQKNDYHKQLWATLNAGEPVDKIPVCVTFEGIPGPQWDLMFGPNQLHCRSLLARQIELDLKKRTWAAANIPDDHVLWPVVSITAVQPGGYDWGVPITWRQSGDELGAKEIVPPFAEKIDLTQLRQPVTQLDEDATKFQVDEARDLVGGRLPVVVRYPRLADMPFDIAVQMRGMENLLIDVVDAPDEVHGLMDFITGAIIADHRHREQRGWINAQPDPSGRYQMVPIWRHIAAPLPADFAGRKPRISDEWAYVSAQTSAGLGPEMYEEFVNAYNCRIAELYTNRTVYYHGCENLDAKLDAIMRLPNLRRHHVSPWSSVKLAAEKMPADVVLEVHAHPTEVMFSASREDMQAEVARLVRQAGGHRMCLNLSDIHSLGGNPATLKCWAQVAQEVASGL